MITKIKDYKKYFIYFILYIHIYIYIYSVIVYIYIYIYIYIYLSVIENNIYSSKVEIIFSFFFMLICI